MSKDITENDVDKYAIVLPCEQQDFGKFISGLLGKPQSLERIFSQTFEITKEDIENTHHLIEQRVHQQNEAALVQFNITIRYNDNSSITHNSFEDFIHYREVRPLSTVAADLSWAYLIKFNDKDVPEKQTIELSVADDAHGIDKTFPTPSKLLNKEKIIQLTINHTARTWASDIEALLTGHIQTFFKRDYSFKDKVAENALWIGLIFGLFFFAIAIYGGYWVAESVSETQLVHIKQFIEPALNDSTAASQGINALLSIHAKGTWAKYYFALIWYVFAAIIASIIVGIWVGVKADNPDKSFLLICKLDQEIRNDYLTKRNKCWIQFFVSMIVSLTIGVLANTVFYYVSKLIITD